MTSEGRVSLVSCLMREEKGKEGGDSFLVSGVEEKERHYTPTSHISKKKLGEKKKSLALLL